MTQPADPVPVGAHPVSGVVHRRSPHSVAGTVERLIEAIDAAGAKLFTVVNHSGEAKSAGLALRDTKLLIFGNPAAGTAIMEAVPTAAIDLPLKILVWADNQQEVWMTYLSADWLARRHGIPPQFAKPLAAVDVLVSRVARTEGHEAGGPDR